MLLFSRAASLVLASFALAPLSAAGVLTVGPAGSGAQFTEIQVAIDAALDGDVILVKPGTYQRITVSKPVRILGDGTGIARISGLGFGAIVRDIGAGKELVLSGFEVRARDAFGQPVHAILLQDCPGTVVLQDLALAFEGSTERWRIGVEIERCTRAVLLDSQILAGIPDSFQVRYGAVLAKDSELWLANSEVRGTSYDAIHGGASAYGVEVVNSRLHVWRSRIHGGGNTIRVDETGSSGAAGIKAVNSTVNLFGGPSSEFIGGNGPYEQLNPVNYPGGPGVDLTQNSRARIQSAIPIQGGLDGRALVRAPAVRADATSSFAYDSEVFPTLVSSVQQAQLGSTFGVTLDGNPGGFQILFLSLRTGPTFTLPRVDGFGLLDRTMLFRIAGEILPPSATHAFNLRVPNLPALIGSTLFFQAAERLGNSYAIGNPVLVTITG